MKNAGATLCWELSLRPDVATLRGQSGAAAAGCVWSPISSKVHFENSLIPEKFTRF
jgi:hypothetical protein